MHAKARRALLSAGVVLLSGAVAQAQQMDAIGVLLQQRAAAAQSAPATPVDSTQQTVGQPLSPSVFVWSLGPAASCCAGPRSSRSNGSTI